MQLLHLHIARTAIPYGRLEAIARQQSINLEERLSSRDASYLIDQLERVPSKE